MCDLPMAWYIHILCEYEYYEEFGVRRRSRSGPVDKSLDAGRSSPLLCSVNRWREPDLCNKLTNR